MAATTERTPLLEDRTAIVPPADDSINAEQPADTEDDKDESTGARVATTIFSMWIVVFLAAMGEILQTAEPNFGHMVIVTDDCPRFYSDGYYLGTGSK